MINETGLAIEEDGDDDGLMLTAFDRKTPAWTKIRRYVEEQIETLRTKNDAPLDAEKTAALRGEIKALKKLLAQAQPDPVKVANDGSGE